MKTGDVRSPWALRPGDTVRLVAPSGLFDPKKLERGIEILRARGLEVVHRSDLFAQFAYLAGDDQRRLQELQEAFDDPMAKAVWGVRGGYGAMRILDRIDLSTILKHPKVFIGFSDLTVIHSVLNQAGLPTLHGPMVAGLGDASPEAMERLWEILEGGADLVYDWEPTAIIHHAVCKGRVLGGNLTLVTNLLGTPFQPDLSGAILLIEEVGEAPYRVDRMLTHLELAKVHEGLAGVLVGEFTGCDSKDNGYSSLEILRERLGGWEVPVAFGFPVGHGRLNLPVPLGLTATLDCARGSLSYEEIGLA